MMGSTVLDRPIGLFINFKELGCIPQVNGAHLEITLNILDGPTRTHGRRGRPVFHRHGAMRLDLRRGAEKRRAAHV